MLVVASLLRWDRPSSRTSGVRSGGAREMPSARWRCGLSAFRSRRTRVPARPDTVADWFAQRIPAEQPAGVARKTARERRRSAWGDEVGPHASLTSRARARFSGCAAGIPERPSAKGARRGRLGSDRRPLFPMHDRTALVPGRVTRQAVPAPAATRGIVAACDGRNGMMAPCPHFSRTSATPSAR